MTDTEFADLVGRVETIAREHPLRYRLTVIGLALLGYAVLGGALVVGLLLAIVCLIAVFKVPWLLKVLIKLIWVPLLLMGALGKALLAKVSPPQGQQLARKDVPELFAAVDALVESTGAKPIDRILLVPDFNAFAAEVPRFGAFFPRRYLGLGLPLLMGLSPAQASAVIAHELGHFSARDGRMGSFIYQLRQLWGRLLEEADLGVLQRFMRWYAPYFNAYSFVLAREQEYAADRHGASLLGAHTMAQALTRTATLNAHLNAEFYAPMRTQARQVAEPPADVYAQMEPLLRGQAGLSFEVDGVMAERTSYADTHPALNDRLSALAVQPSLGEFEVSAADAWLGPALQGFVAQFSDEWQAQTRGGWQAAHQQAKAEQAQLEQLAALDERTPEQEFRLLTLRWEGRESEPEYMTELAQLAASKPSAGALYTWGARTLGEQPEPAIQALQRAAELDPEARVPVASVLVRHFHATEQMELAAPYIRQLEAADAANQADEQERNQLPVAKDVYLPQPGDQERAALTEALRLCPKIKQVRIARVRLSHGDGENTPHYLLAVTLGGIVMDAKSHLQKLVETFELDGTWLAMVESELPRSLRKAMKKQALAVKR